MGMPNWLGLNSARLHNAAHACRCCHPSTLRKIQQVTWVTQKFKVPDASLYSEIPDWFSVVSATFVNEKPS